MPAACVTRWRTTSRSCSSMRRSRSDGRAGWRAGGPVLAGLLLAAAPPARLHAQVANNSGALFLVFPVGAQAVGMGQAGMAVEGRGEAAFRSDEETAEIQSHS